MTLFWELRTNMTAVFGRYSVLITMIFKFAVAMIAFMALKNAVPTESFITNTFLILAMALLCAILPLAAIPTFGGIILLGLSLGLGLPAFGLTGLVLLLLLCLFLRFSSEGTLLLIFVPAALYFGVPEVVPVCAGLRHKVSSVLPIGCGVIVYYLVKALHDFAGTTGSGSSASSSDLLAGLQGLAGGIFGQKEMILNLVIVCAVFIVVYAVRSLPLKGSYMAAVIGGSVFYTMMMAFGSTIAGFSVSFVVLIAGCAVSVIAALIYLFFIHDVNYKATEYLQFEDDDFFYYVKAMPKVSVKTAFADNMIVDDDEDDDEDEGEENA